MRSLAPGSLVDRYELVSPIGEGGMAEVWVARQKGKHGFEKLFAFKCIHHRFAEVPAFRSMFLDEARIASAIEHPNVAQIYDLGESGSMLYLVMEYVDGESLGSLMISASRRTKEAATVPTAVALRIIADACAGLDAAHRLKGPDGKPLGVVHRDVSPQNILVSVRGDVKVIDFGIAHATDRIGSDTRDGSLKGKLHYMAPEQARHEQLGPYTDVFGLGATFYRMLAGRPPFDGGNDAATLHLLLGGSPPPPLPDTIPPLVTAIVERALSPDPGDRYATTREMRGAIEQALAEEVIVRDVSLWVRENLSETTNERRAQLATRTMHIRPDGSAHESGHFSSAAPAPLPVGAAPMSVAFGTPAFVAELEIGTPIVPRGPSLASPHGATIAGVMPGVSLPPSSSEPISLMPVSDPSFPVTMASATSSSPTAVSAATGNAAAAGGASGAMGAMGASASSPPSIDPGSPSALELMSVPPRGAPAVPERGGGGSAVAGAAAMPDNRDLEERSMMDIHALVARQRAGPRAELSAMPEAAPPPRLSPPEPEAPRREAPARREAATEAEPPPARVPRRSYDIETSTAPARDVDYVGPETRAKPLAAGVLGARFIRIAAIVTGVVIGIVALLMVLPAIVKSRVVTAARDAGIELTVDRVGVGFGNVALHGVTAKAARVPSATVHADEIFVTGLSAREVRVRGLELGLTGPLTDVVPSLQRFYEESRGRIAGSAADPRKIAIVSAHVTWNGLYDLDPHVDPRGPQAPGTPAAGAHESTQLQAGELNVELESRGIGLEDIRSSVGSFTVKTRRTTFGPWSGTYDRAVASSRVRLLFDPPVPDGPAALVVWTPTSPPHVTVKIARSPITHLGLRPADLGLPADDATELELKLEGGQSPTMRNEGTATLGLYSVRLKGLKQPVDVKIEGSASGQPGKPLDLEKTSMTVGPFVAAVTGTVQPGDLGFRLDAAWRTQPIACEKLARAEAKAMGPFAAALQDIAHATGIARVTGTANASGVVKYDTKTPDDATSTLLTREACGLSIFGM